MCMWLEKCQKIQGWESVKVLWCHSLIGKELLMMSNSDLR